MVMLQRKLLKLLGEIECWEKRASLVGHGGFFSRLGRRQQRIVSVRIRPRSFHVY